MKNLFLSLGILILIAVPVHAQVLPNNNSDYSVRVDSPHCKNDNGNCGVVFDKSGKKVTEFIGVNSHHYHPFEIRGNELFWLTRPKDYHADKTWADELWVQDLKTLKKNKIVDGQGLDYRVSPDGSKIFYHLKNNVYLLDRLTNKTVEIAKNGENSAVVGYDIIGFSNDGKRFWFGPSCSCPEGWSKLALLQDGKLRWFDFYGADDGFLETNRGWIVRSTYPGFVDSQSAEEFKKNKIKTELFVEDVFSGKKILIAASHSEEMAPKWKDPDTLEYKIGKKKFNIKAEEIVKRLEKSPTKASK